jgi:predicted nucleic acid-binding protein
MLFCDTSTLAKYYVPETASAVVRSRLDSEDQVVLSQLARAESMAVFHRRLRERTWTQEEFRAIVRQFFRDDIGGFGHGCRSTVVSSSRL